MQNPLVSIIIPTYNRVHLIGETLESILAQTYTNWECIVVDDGSTDGTDELMKKYRQKDSRINYYHRPEDRLPGGNAARNYGFEKSIGNYIQWFDSDDLLQPNKLEQKVKAMIKFNCDYVISKTRLIDQDPVKVNMYDALKESDINFESYSTGPVSWYTPDLLIKRIVAEKVKFNEVMRSGQEYNYCCKLLLHSTNLKVVDEFLTLRRDTHNSIGNKRRISKNRFLKSRFDNYWLNYVEIHNTANSSVFDQDALLRCLSCYFRAYPVIELPTNFKRELWRVFRIKSMYFYLAYLTIILIGKYHYFYNKLKS